MTVFRLKTNPETGDLAIYSVPSHESTDNAPLDDPYGHPGRLQLHTGMICPSTTPELTQTHTVNFPARAAQTKFSALVDLFPHGKGEPCMVEGAIKGIGPGGADVAFNGTMPVNANTRGFATWLALCSTNTHVALLYFGITRTAFPAFSLDIEASAYDFLASGPAPTSNPALPLKKYVPGEYLQLGRGMIDTRRRYLRKVAIGGDFAMAIGPTLSIIGSGKTRSGSYVQNEIGWRWRYSCDGYVQETTVGWNGSATNGGTHNAPFIRVKR